MANVRASVVFQGASNLPEDRFVNTFHFTATEAFDTHAASIATALDGFYTATHAPSTVAVGATLSLWVNRSFTINCYNLADPMPRVPITTTHTLPAQAALYNDNNLPEEVACVASFHGDPPITRSKRGRVYIGPLGGGATIATTGAPVRASSGLQGIIKDAMIYLGSLTAGWAVYSPKNGTFALVTGGSVDNAFDTQRRRGPKPTTKVVWP